MSRPFRFYAFELNSSCDLPGPPRLAVWSINTSDLELLAQMKKRFTRTHAELDALQSMTLSYVAGELTWFLLPEVPKEILQFLATSFDEPTSLNEEQARLLTVGDGGLFVDEQTHIDREGVWFTAVMKDTDGTITTGRLLWNVLLKKGTT